MLYYCNEWERVRKTPQKQWERKVTTSGHPEWVTLNDMGVIPAIWRKKRHKDRHEGICPIGLFFATSNSSWPKEGREKEWERSNLFPSLPTLSPIEFFRAHVLTSLCSLSPFTSLSFSLEQNSSFSVLLLLPPSLLSLRLYPQLFFLCISNSVTILLYSSSFSFSLLLSLFLFLFVSSSFSTKQWHQFNWLMNSHFWKFTLVSLFNLSQCQ